MSYKEQYLWTLVWFSLLHWEITSCVNNMYMMQQHRSHCCTYLIFLYANVATKSKWNQWQRSLRISFAIFFFFLQSQKNVSQNSRVQWKLSGQKFKSRCSLCPSRVHFNIFCPVAIASPFIFPLVRPLHPLANLQLLQSVLVHLSLGQKEADDACGESYHPGERHDLNGRLTKMSPVTLW